MNRRDFLALSATATAMAGLPYPLAAAGDDWAKAFRAALAEKPWLLGWLGTNEARLETPALSVEGTIPDALSGTLYRNGPAQHEVGGRRYQHWFDGDGMVQAFRIGGGTVSHLGRLVQTAKLSTEEKADRPVEMTFGTYLPDMRRAANADALNTANINMLHHGGELLALWEGGSAYRIEPDTLDTIGPKTWNPLTKGLPFSAHPRVDSQGTLWSFGYASSAGAIVLYRIDPAGTLVEQGIVRMERVPMVHDFVVTERQVLLVLPPLYFDGSRPGAFLDRHVWDPDAGTRILIFDKDDLTKHRTVEMPAYWVFHFGNAWEDKAGTVHLDLARYDDPSLMFETLRWVMRGEYRPGKTARPYRMTVDPAAGTATAEAIAEDAEAEFPRIDERLTGRRHRRLILLGSDGAAPHPLFNAVVRVDPETGKRSFFSYGAHAIAEEHVFVPRPGGTGEDDGWVLGTVLDYKAGVTRLTVFDAARIGDGPLAVASLPYALPLGLHGTFVAA
ncbi:MAG: carotenoid oxygenase family protein [Minwuiales bacterium]|nr:carotenoid oxygenase family protein [Minwuiales bacterium]